MAQTLQINNHRYQLVSSMADGLYLIEINTHRRLIILAFVLLLLLAGYFLLSLTDFNFNTPWNIITAVNTPAYEEPSAAMVHEKHISLDTEIPADSNQHAVYLYYDQFDLMETFLPARSEEP